MRKAILSVVAIALISLLGCKQTKQFGGEPRLVADNPYPMISLSPSSTEILSTVSINFDGRTSACDYPPSVGQKQIFGGVKPDYEAINRFKPKTIVIESNLYSDAEVKKLEQTGASIYSFKATKVEDFIKELYVLGNKAGSETEIASYVEKIYRERSSAIGEKPAKAYKTVIIMPGANGLHMIAGVKSFQAEVIRDCGLDVVGPQSDRFEPVSGEYLATENPEMIVVAGATKDLLADKRLTNIDAVKNLKLFGIESAIILRRGGRIDQFYSKAHKAIQILTAQK
jgi:iron complex transport system substrate-binding protein